MIDVLVTLPFTEAMIADLQAVSPSLVINQIRAFKTEDISSEVWATVEVLYTDRVLPIIEQAPNLKWIQFHWAGVNHAIGAPILSKPDLLVATLSGVAASKVAEYSLLMLQALGNHMPELFNHQRKVNWPTDRWERFKPRELRESTVGIVGYGSIGRQIARLLHPFGAKVLATKRNAMQPIEEGYTPEGWGDPQGDYIHRLYPAEALGSMIKDCDFVVVTVPLTPATRNLVSAEVLNKFKPTAYLVDVSRGGVVDQAALISALKEGRIAGAALDVFPIEPLPPDSPLWKMPNVIVTPHVAGITDNYDQRASVFFCENLKRYVNGLPLLNNFDPQRGY